MCQIHKKEASGGLPGWHKKRGRVDTTVKIENLKIGLEKAFYVLPGTLDSASELVLLNHGVLTHHEGNWTM
jgi:hypothetical protein